MAHSEACQLFIEQQIDEGLQEGKTPYSIGKDLAVWIEKLFEAKIPADTLKKRAQRAQEKLGTNVPNPPTQQKDSGIEENFVDSKSVIPANVGRPPKFRCVPESIVNKMTGEIEGYTPKEYIEATRYVLGSIDCDPASNAMAQEIVQAKTYYTLENDGLSKEWNGAVFLNPPYKQPDIKFFIQKLLDEIDAKRTTKAILLTNNNTDTRWFHCAALKSQAICFTSGRINFYKPDGSITQPTNGQAFFFWGPQNALQRFVEKFSEIGLIVRVYGNQ